MDNAATNGTVLEAINDSIPSITAKDGLCCAGHIMNLVVEALLYGEGITESAKGIIRCGDGETFRLWWKFSAIGKIHNTVKYTMRSDQRR